jgi:uncharacterized protein (DUF1499 family)
VNEVLLARALVAAAVAAALAVVASGYGARFGAWDVRTGFGLLRWGAYAALTTAAVALVALAVPRVGARARVPLVVALAIGGLAGALPLGWTLSARSLPPINDITTDLADPPAFVALLPLRAKASVPAAYPGAKTADQQRRAYPDIAPVHVPEAPPAAFAKALAAARAAGWTIVAADAAAGRIEATATTPWFGFRDDVVVRVAAADRGSRIDVRSVSRVGVGDLGTNASRVRGYVAAVVP